MEHPPAVDSAFQGELLNLIITALILILLSMIFSATESAFLSINKLRLRFLREKKNKRAILAAKLLEKKDILLNTILIGNNLVNIALSAIITSIALKLYGPRGVGYATLLVTLVLLIFGEITPKTIGNHNSEKVAFFFAPLIHFFTVLLRPLVICVTACAKGIAKIFGIQFAQKNVSFTEDEIKNFIDVGEEEGLIRAGEKRMMHRVFKFTDLSARDIMIPRTRIISVPLETSWRSLIELSQKQHLSRFPVHGKDIDDIKGLFYMKDILSYASSPEKFLLKDVMRSPLFILESKKMSSIQQLLLENHQTVAIVMDEYSGIAGMLTVEDIAKEIFGPIYDEYDAPTVHPFFEASENELICNGATHLDHLNDAFHLNLASKNYETIAGFILEHLDKIPNAGDSFIDSGAKITVVEVTDRQILKVRIEHCPQKEEKK